MAENELKAVATLIASWFDDRLAETMRDDPAATAVFASKSDMLNLLTEHPADGEQWTAESERQLIVESARSLAQHYRRGDPTKCDPDTLEAAAIVIEQFADNIEALDHHRRAGIA